MPRSLLQIPEYDPDEMLARAAEPHARPCVYVSEQNKGVQFSWRQFSALSVLYCMFVASSSGQETGTKTEQLNVNWIYGAYIAKGAPVVSLTRDQRFKLYVRQSFTSPGIYVKTGLFSLGDQADNSPQEWGGGFAGYGRRVASRHGQFVIQNSLASLGNALLQYEPRYDRCSCAGFWPRTGHAFLRNFVTYDKTETAMRPQLALYGAALAAGVTSSTWKPKNEVWHEGYRSVLTQAAFGLASNWLGEFALEITRVVRKPKHEFKSDNP